MPHKQLALGLRTALFSLLSLAAVNSALADDETKEALDVITITAPRPTVNLDFSAPAPQETRPTRHCLKNTGTRLRSRGQGKCAVAAGQSIQGNELQHRGWGAISPSARLKDSSTYY